MNRDCFLSPKFACIVILLCCISAGGCSGSGQPALDAALGDGPLPTDSGGDAGLTEAGAIAPATRDPIASVAADPFAASAIESCATYQQERCVAATQMRCAVYDVDQTEFVSSPDPLLERVLLYDRWYDLYHSPDGQRAVRVFKESIDPGTPESDWGQPEKFQAWTAIGDSAIFTGGALVAKVFRYASWGTEAEYQRMEAQVRQSLLMFDVTGIPGYLARHHYLKMPEGAPKSDQHILHEPTYDGDFNHHRFDPVTVEGIPAAYLDGIADQNGKLWQGEAMWWGNPSIDQYTGPTVALVMAHSLLRDQKLKDRITQHLTCYVKRLRRFEIRNIQQNALLAEAAQALLGGAGLKVNLDPGDPDLSQTDTIIGYYLPSYNSKNEASFDKSCPATLNSEDPRVIDASASDWLTTFLEFATDIQAGSKESATGIDHFYLANFRGADASHLMHLALIAYHLTGEAQYAQFLNETLIGELQTDHVAMTLAALTSPSWCYEYFADHIIIPTHWALLTMLEPSDFKTKMQQVMEDEAWSKRAFNQRNLKFNLMYASEVPQSIGSQTQDALSQALEDLETLGGNGGILKDPRRSYSLDPQYVIDNLPAGTSLRCPTEDERKYCDEGISILGIQLGAASPVSRKCADTPGECKFSDGKCSRGLTTVGLPPPLRKYEGQMWQRSPFELGATYAVEGTKQTPGIELTEPYWLAKYYGYVGGANRQVLAWQSIGSCAP